VSWQRYTAYRDSGLTGKRNPTAEDAEERREVVRE